MVGTDSEVEDQIEGSLLAETINRFLAGLDEEVCKMFVQRYWYMLSVKEIAVGMDVSESKVKMTLLRTRDKMKTYLLKEGYDI